MLFRSDNIKNGLIRNRNVITVTPVIVDPDYIFVTVRGKAYYNTTLTTKTSNELLEVIKNAVFDYTDAALNNYQSVLKKSKLQSSIETSDTSITGSDLTVFLQSRKVIDLTTSKKYTFSFKTPIQKGTFTNKLFTYPQITVLDSSQTSRNVFYEEVPDSFTGVDMVDIVNPGINYTSANVTINGDGTGATAKATIENGRIVSIQVTNKGVNYSRALIQIEGNGTEAEAKEIGRAHV